MKKEAKKIYPDSGVELRPLTALNYDWLLDVASLGLYRRFIRRAIQAMGIQSGDKILDLGCGTGRNSCLMAEYLGKDGRITGLDISPIMERQFIRKCAGYRNVSFVRQRIDQVFDLHEQFDKIFISFVIHGFPHEVRRTVLKNVFNHLKSDGIFFMLDYAEFKPEEMPPLFRYIFNRMECRYAFDFIARDWKQILMDHNFDGFEEVCFFRNYVRLLKIRRHQ
ncbi:MAG: class I SAM-dependent methyltransferase [Fidelibacterota bacterium]